MDNNNTLFLVSGFLSISLFIFFSTLFTFIYIRSSDTKIYSYNKDNYISVSIELQNKNIKKVKKNIVAPAIVDDAAVQTKEVDIAELFSDVWTKDIKIAKKEKPKQNNKRYQAIEKRINTIKKVSSSSATKKVQEMQVVSDSDENINSSSGDEVNKYLAKIQALVYKYFIPPQNSQGNSVKAVIELSSIGKVLDFRILDYSASEDLNNECDKIKNRLMGVLFPINPDNKTDSYIIILKSKEN